MFVDIKYLNLLSSQLGKFKQVKRNLWNFRCPICGDSKKNKNKARGFVFEVRGDLVYKCHNCQVSMSVSKLIEKLDTSLYKEYRMEKFKNSNKPRVDMRKVTRVVSTTPTFNKKVLPDLVKIDDLNKTHPAREYILNRKLPTDALYYTEKFKEWVNTVKPDTFEDITQDEGRIIIPFKSKEGSVFGFQGRSLSSSGLRYITILLQEDQPKVFGLERIDYEKNVFICEGPLDSLLLKNAVAMAGADMSSCTGWFPHGRVYIYDNEPRNEQICSRIKKHITSGESVVIWPSTIKEKDINDMVLSGHNVQHIVESNTFNGLTAKLKYQSWVK